MNSAQRHILIVGVGSIGERHVRCFRATGRCTLAICEPQEALRNEVGERYNVNSYPNWETALEREHFSAAVIATPAPWHIPIAKGLTEKRLNLLIEKPLSLSTDGVLQLAESIQMHETRVAVGFVYRALPALQRMRAAVQAGRFGHLVQIQVQAGQHFPFYRPAYREIYYANPALGGGLIQDMLPHFLNAVEWFAGPTTKVVVDAEHQVLPGVDVEDTVHLLTRHNQVMASFSLNQHQPVNESVITVLCERGAARWELSGHRWLSASEIGGDWIEEESFVHQRDDYYILQANAFLDYLDGQSEPLCTLAEATSTLHATLAILQSRKSGCWVACP
ncbi:MAG: Gfo/Idh/MocA family oxidoreductase [Pirellulaceae bacterium]